ncbi:substrate-binding domain-containing protein [Luethyella okanaganae]|uniref:Substrate-binding domain-containing protein n=1 Tax=Luethyella okanaganae TaxID=69372 RepID=A0ABW1VI37_9MICO
MQIGTKWRLGALATVAAAAVVLAGGTAAIADPTGTPSYRTLSGVGSDTTQDLNNGLSSVITYGGSLVAGSYDAINPTTGAVHDPITTKSGGTIFDRPNGSGEGLTALKAAKSGGTLQWRGKTLSATDIQFSRSSSGATWVAGGGGAYSYIPLAEDAVSFAVHTSNTTIPRDLTKAQLTAIYSAANGANVTINGTSYKVGTPGTAGVQITPFIPQSGSGTRSFWQTQLVGAGVAFGPAVTDTYSGGSVQEHDGSVLAALPTTAIVPFSIAQWIAQSNKATIQANYPGVTINDRRNGAVLGKVGGISPTTVSNTLNTAFPIARPVFTVVKASELATNPQLTAVFKGSTASAYTVDRPGPSTALVITDFGFGSLAGGVNIGGVTYNPGDTTSFTIN